jgi:hypothetical protein
MKRAVVAVGAVCGVLAIVLLVAGVREEWLVGPLLVIGVIGLGFTVGGAAGMAGSD